MAKPVLSLHDQQARDTAVIRWGTSLRKPSLICSFGKVVPSANKDTATPQIAKQIQSPPAWGESQFATPVTSALGRWRQGAQEFRVSPGHIVSSWPNKPQPTKNKPKLLSEVTGLSAEGSRRGVYFLRQSLWDLPKEETSKRYLYETMPGM